MCIKRRAQCPAPAQFHPVVAGLGFCRSGSLTVSNSHVLRLSEAGRLFPTLSGSSLTLSQRLGSQTPDTDRPKGSSLWSQTTKSSQNGSPWTQLPPPHTQAPAPRALRADLTLPPRSPGCSFCSSLKDSHPPSPLLLCVCRSRRQARTSTQTGQTWLMLTLQPFTLCCEIDCLPFTGQGFCKHRKEFRCQTARPYPTLQKAKSTTFIIRLLIQGHKYSCRRTGEAREFSVRMTQVGGVHRGDCLSLSDAFSLAPADRFCTRSCIIKITYQSWIRAGSSV